MVHNRGNPFGERFPSKLGEFSVPGEYATKKLQLHVSLMSSIPIYSLLNIQDNQQQIIGYIPIPIYDHLYSTFSQPNSISREITEIENDVAQIESLIQSCVLGSDPMYVQLIQMQFHCILMLT